MEQLGRKCYTKGSQGNNQEASATQKEACGTTRKPVEQLVSQCYTVYRKPVEQPGSQCRTKGSLRNNQEASALLKEASGTTRSQCYTVYRKPVDQLGSQCYKKGSQWNNYQEALYQRKLLDQLGSRCYNKGSQWNNQEASVILEEASVLPKEARNQEANETTRKLVTYQRKPVGE